MAKSLIDEAMANDGEREASEILNAFSTFHTKR